MTPLFAGPNPADLSLSSFTCALCDNRIPVADLATVGTIPQTAPDGHHSCQSCLDTNVTLCDGCAERFFNVELHHDIFGYDTSRRRTVCDTCSFTCRGCDTRFWGDGYTHDGHTYCESCYNDDFISCFRCDDTISVDNFYSHNAETYCESCYREVEDEDEEGHGILESHDHCPILTFHSAPGEIVIHPPMFEEAPPVTPYFGLEIECELPLGHSYSDEEHNITFVTSSGLWYAKKDGSLENGVEFVSHPGTLAFWRNNAFPWCAKLKSRKFRSYHTTTCGIHIHISRDCLSDTEWYRMAAFFRASPSLVRRAARRELNRYCELHENESNRTLVSKVRKRGPINRYQALNFEPADTVECRIFRGTLHASAILNYLEFVNSVLQFVRTTTMPHLRASQYLTWLTSPEAISLLGEPACTALTSTLDLSRTPVPSISSSEQ